MPGSAPSRYQLRGRFGPRTRALTYGLIALTAVLIGVTLWLLLTGREGGLIALGMAMLVGPQALLLGLGMVRANGVLVDLTLDDAGMQSSAAGNSRYVRWADVRKVDVAGSDARFHLADGTGVLLTYPGAEDAPEWLEIQEDIASRLDADRGYQHRICVDDAAGAPAGSGCGDALGCAGQDTCQLHALKQTRA